VYRLQMQERSSGSERSLRKNSSKPISLRLPESIVALAGFAFCCPVFAQAPVAAYSFNASSGTTLTDVSGNSNTITLQNGPVWTSGKYGNALSFDAANDVGVANAGNSTLNLTGKKLTLSAWIKPLTNSGWRMIVNKPYTTGHSAPYFDWSMHREPSSGRLVAFLGCDGQQRTSSSATPLNTWTHVAITYDGSAIRHYINGVLDRTTAVSCSVTNTNSRPIRLGANGAGGEVLRGLIDDVRIYNRPLTAIEIQADMSTPLPSSVASAPTVSLSANPTSAPSGSSSTLIWSSTNATSCTASGAWTGTKATSGSWSTGALSSTRTYTLTCTGAGGSASKSVTVTIASGVPAPSLSLSASPTSVASGGQSNLTWSSSNATSCTASGAWSGSRPTSGSESTSALTAALNTFTLTCIGTGGTTSRSVTVTVSGSTSGSTQLRGLDFQGSASTTGTVRFRFTNPLAIYPATYVWKVRPRHQLGYYTTFFWGNDGQFLWSDCSGYKCADTYYGAHPYPPGGSSGSTHKWEIAARQGDYQSVEYVVYDRWYTQALRVWSDSAGKHHEFYWDLPNTSRVLRLDLPTSYGNKMPPSPALTFGDAPWAPSREIMKGVIRGIQVYSSALTLTEVLSELSAPLSTSKGASSIWYMNLNPTPTDISDKSGRGHNPQWVGSERPLLWSGN
jgi:Concanavalin A-like lectin/glucanases superfamily